MQALLNWSIKHSDPEKLKQAASEAKEPKQLSETVRILFNNTQGYYFVQFLFCFFFLSY